MNVHMVLMKAAIYREFCGPIRVETVPRPTLPSEDGVIIQVQATGVCRSDWHGWKGHDGDIKAHGLPFCPGHEVAGVIVQVGKKVRQFAPGDGVAIPFILSCGRCSSCAVRNRPTVCLEQEQPGFTMMGSYAEYLALPRADRNLRKLPPNVSFVQAAALGCRFTTAFRALKQQGRLKPKESVAILGVGGLGLSCIMIAHAEQANPIVAVDISPLALEKARQLGATHTILACKSDTAQDIQQKLLKVAPYGVDVSVDAAGFLLTSEAAVYCTRVAGRMIQVGLPATSPPIPMGLVAGKELELIGSHGFDAVDLPDLLEMVSMGKLDPAVLVEKEVTLEEGCQALMEMDKASPLGMVMITKFNDDSNTSRI